MVLTHDIGLAFEDWTLVLDRLLDCSDVEYQYEQVIERVAADHPQLAVEHLLGRCDQEPDNWRYDALPHDGLATDPLAAAPELRAPMLGEIARRLASCLAGRRSTELPVLYWSLAGDGADALTVIGDSLVAGGERRDAASLLLGGAPGGRILASPEWVAAQLDAAPAGEPLDGLRAALHGALRSGSRQGTPGQPFPEDVALARRARELLAESRAGSRASRFWSDLADAVEVEMREEVLRDRDLLDE